MPDVITTDERRVIDEAIAAGRVWKVPRGTYTEAAPGGWRGAASGRVLVTPDGRTEMIEPDRTQAPTLRRGWPKGKKRGPTENTRDMIERIKALAAEGLHAALIAERLGITSGNLSRISKTYGLTLPKAPKRSFIPRGPSEKNRARLDRIRSLARQGLTTPQIAEHMGLTYHAVRKLMLRHDIDVAPCLGTRPAA